MASLRPVTVQSTGRSEPSARAQRLRAEAQVIRRDAERTTAADTRRQLLNIAAQYDRLAESAERGPR